MKHLLRNLGLSIFLVLVVLGAALSWLLGTHAGLRFGLAQVPGLQVEEIQGRLWDKTVLRGVRYHQDGIQVNIGEAVLNWRPAALWWRTVHIVTLAGHEIEIVLPPPQESTASTAPLRLPDITLPLDVRINELAVSALRLRQGDAVQVIEDFRLQAHTDRTQSRLVLSTLRLRTPELEASVQGHADLQTPHPLTLALKWQLAAQSISGEINIHGHRNELQIDAKLLPHENLPHLEVSAVLSDVLEQLRWRAELQVNELDTSRPYPVFAGLPPLQARAHIGASGDLNNLEFQGEAQLQAEDYGQFTLSWRGQGNLAGQWQLEQLRLQELTDALPMILEATATVANKQFDVRLSWHAGRWPLIGAPLLTMTQGEMQATGALDNYRLTLNTQLDSAHLPPGQWEMAGQGDLNHFVLESLRAHLSPGALTAQAEVQWQPELHVQAHVRGTDLVPEVAEWPDTLGMNVEFMAELAQQKFHLRDFYAEIPAQDAHLKASASGALSGDDLNANMTWHNLHWPLDNTPLAHSESGQITISGSTAAYNLEMVATARGAQFPPLSWRLNGQGNLQEFNLKNLYAEVLGGTLAADGHIAWDADTRWDVRANAENIAAQEYWPQAPAKLSFALTSAATLRQGQLHGNIELQDFSGIIENLPVTAQARVQGDEQGYHIQRFDFRSKGAHGQIKGRVGDKLDLNWTLEIAALEDFPGGARGRLRSDGSLSGSVAQAQIKAKINGTGLGWQDLALESLDADADVNLQADAPLRVDIRAKNLRQGEQFLEKLHIQAEGRTRQHQLSAQINAPDYGVDLRLRGGFDPLRQDWRGQIEKATFQNQYTLALDAPASLHLAQDRAELEQACWQLQNARLCAQGQWQAQGAAAAKLFLADFDLAMLAPLLGKDVGVQGRLEAQMDASLQPGCATPPCVRAQARVEVSPGRVQSQWDDGTPVDISHQGASVEAHLDEQGGQVQWSIRLPQEDLFSGGLSLPGLQLPPADTQALHGAAHLQIRDFSLLNALLPDIQGFVGHLEGNLRVDGTLAQPLLQGELNLSESKAEIPIAGLELSAIEIHIKGEDNGQIKLSGGLRSGGGELKLNGDFHAAEQGWQGQVTVSGKEVEVLNTPDGWVFVSPDLQLRLMPQHLHISGEVQVPRAELTPEGGGGDDSSYIAASDDVVWVGTTAAEDSAARAQKFIVSSDVRLVLGDKVRVEAFGFKGNVSGHLRSRSENNKAPIANGEIRVSGTYKSYGQDLSVEQGLVLFNNSQLDNPGLNLRATRRHEADNVTSGVYVRGSAQEPEVTLFSEPVMDQANALSYLVLGGPLGSNSSQSDSDTLMRAAASLPLGKSSFLTRRLGQDLGLDEARVSSEGNLELGKQLTPRLYLKYMSSLFEPGHILKLRYRLTRSLHLETEAGKETGVDLLYTLER
jgi:translocation and assembly module TamB